MNKKLARSTSALGGVIALGLMVVMPANAAPSSEVGFELHCQAYQGPGDFGNTQSTAIQLTNNLGAIDPASSVTFNKITIYDQNAQVLRTYQASSWPTSGFKPTLNPNESTRFNTRTIFPIGDRVGLLQVVIEGVWKTTLPPGQLSQIETAALAQSMVVDVLTADNTLQSRAFLPCVF
jgi:hypothetical protein